MQKIILILLFCSSSMLLRSQSECTDIRYEHNIQVSNEFTDIQREEDTITFTLKKKLLQGDGVHQQFRYLANGTFLDSSSWQLPAMSFFARTGDIFSIVKVDTNNFVLTKMNYGGQIIWQNALLLANTPPNGVQFNDIDVAADGKIYLCGFVPATFLPPLPLHTGLLVCLDDLGNLIWTKKDQLLITSEGYEQLHIVGDKVLTSYKFNISGPHVLTEFALDGSQKWQNQFSSHPVSNILGIVPFKNKGIAMTRWVTGYNGPSGVSYLTVIDSTGTTLLNEEARFFLNDPFFDNWFGLWYLSGIHILENGHYWLSVSRSNNQAMVRLDENLQPLCYVTEGNLGLIHAFQLDTETVAVIVQNNISGEELGFIPLACVPSCDNFVSSSLDHHKELEKIVLSPNPGQTLIHIQTQDDTRLLILQLLDAQGRILLEQTDLADQEHTVLDIGQLPNGAYWVTIITNDGLLTKQFLVLR